MKNNSAQSATGIVCMLAIIGGIGAIVGVLFSVIFNEIDRLRSKLFDIKDTAEQAKERTERVSVLSSDVAGLRAKLDNLQHFRSEVLNAHLSVERLEKSVERLEEQVEKLDDEMLDRPLK